MHSKVVAALTVVMVVAAFFLGRGNADAQAAKPATARTVWEYKDGANLSEAQLNVLGADGWELCTLVQYGKDYYYVFKRPK